MLVEGSFPGESLGGSRQGPLKSCPEAVLSSDLVAGGQGICECASHLPYPLLGEFPVGEGPCSWGTMLHGKERAVVWKLNSA